MASDTEMVVEQYAVLTAARRRSGIDTITRRRRRLATASQNTCKNNNTGTRQVERRGAVSRPTS